MNTKSYKFLEERIWENLQYKAFILIFTYHYLTLSIIIKRKSTNPSQTLSAADRDHWIRAIEQNASNEGELKVSPVYPFAKMIHSQACKINMHRRMRINWILFKMMFLLLTLQLWLFFFKHHKNDIIYSIVLYKLEKKWNNSYLKYRCMDYIDFIY